MGTLEGCCGEPQLHKSSGAAEPSVSRREAGMISLPFSFSLLSFYPRTRKNTGGRHVRRSVSYPCGKKKILPKTFLMDVSLIPRQSDSETSLAL